MIDPNDTLASLARTIPSATPVFHRYHFDFCCGGTATLAEACAAGGLVTDAVAAEIEAATRRPEIRWDERSPAEIIEHILDFYHAPLRPEIARLRDLARKVETVHAGNPSCPRGLAAHLSVMADAIEEHLAKEEQILFPMILSGNLGFVRMPIQVMFREHDDHGAALRRTRDLTEDFTLPEADCTSWAALYLGLEQLERDLMDHIHLENNVLFPMVLNG